MNWSLGTREIPDTSILTNESRSITTGDSMGSSQEESSRREAKDHHYDIEYMHCHGSRSKDMASHSRTMRTRAESHLLLFQSSRLGHYMCRRIFTWIESDGTSPPFHNSARVKSYCPQQGHGIPLQDNANKHRISPTPASAISSGVLLMSSDIYVDRKWQRFFPISQLSLREVLLRTLPPVRITFPHYHRPPRCSLRDVHIVDSRAVWLQPLRIL